MEQKKKSFQEKVDKVAEKLYKVTNLKYIKIIMNGFMSIAALSIAGSLFSLIKSIPIPVWQDFLTNSGLGAILAIPIAVTSDLISVFVVLAMAYETAVIFEKKPFAPAVVALGAFMILTPFTGPAQVVTAEGETIIATALNVIPLTGLGARGVFLAMICGILASRFYIFLIDKKIYIKMPGVVPPSVGQMFETMIPGGVVFTVVLVLRWLFSLTSFGTVQNFIYTIIQNPIMGFGATFGGAMVYLFFHEALWLVGIHGGLITYATMEAIMKTTGAANTAAFAAGEPVPYLLWGIVALAYLVKSIAISLDMLLFSKSTQYKSLGKLSLPTSLFNISEPLVYGMPVVMNPIMVVPWVLSAPISLVLTYWVMKIGLIAPITGAQISTSLPVPLYLSFLNGSFSGFLWGLVLIVINMLMFLPFILVGDRTALRREKDAAAMED